MASTAAYAATPRYTYVQISTANTNRDGTGTIGTLFTAGSSGSRVDDIRICATGTTTAGVIRLFASLDNGTTNRLIREILVPAVTPSTTVEAWSTLLSDLGIVLPDANALLRVSTHNAETFNVHVTRAGNF